jgi:hypothetical protein
MAVASAIVTLLGVYLALGLVFAVVFVTAGVGRVDPAARQGTWGFRVLIIPGVAVLWPLLLRRWSAGADRPPEERNAHRLAARRPPPATGGGS